MTTRYNIGRSFEYKTIQSLLSKGYWCVRSAGSRGVADIVALAPPYVKNPILLISCKKHGIIPKNEKQEIYDLAKHIGAVPLVASDIRGGVLFKKLVSHRVFKEGEPEFLAAPYEV